MGEAKSLLDVPKNKGTPLPANARFEAQRFMQYLGVIAGVEQPSGWFETTGLLDLYCRRGGMEDVRRLASTCVSVVCLVRKNQCSTCRLDLDALAKEASRFALWLQRLGFLVDADISTDDIKADQMRVLKVMRWVTNRPSEFTWISALCKRFDIMTRGVMGSKTDFVCKSGSAAAQSLIAQQPASSSMTPRSVANGLFCLGLITTGLLPKDALLPAHVDVAIWDGLFPFSSCSLPSEHVKEMIAMVQVAANCSLDALRA